MLKEVLKKGGRKEKFDLEKIKKAISLAVSGANFSEEKKKEISEKIFSKVLEFLEEKKEIATVEIEAKILLELDKAAPEVAKIWREHRLKKKKP